MVAPAVPHRPGHEREEEGGSRAYSSYSAEDLVASQRHGTSSGGCAANATSEITLVNRENFFVLTPLLFESCSGRLELRHCAQPIRAALRRTRFIEANVDHVDVERQTVRAVSAEGTGYDLPYDQLVVALGAATNDRLIPGSSNAFTFKTMADALVLRNHVIEQFERADATAEASTRRGCLTIVVIGGGLVGVELLGELTAFVEDVLRFYPRIRRDEIRFLLFEAGARILPELDEKLAAVAANVLRRRGADLHASTAVQSIEPGGVRVGDEIIDAGTIVLTAGIVPSVVASEMSVMRDQRGRIAVDATMRSRSHPNVWALGDCAAIPGPDGRPYPALAQHTVREAGHLARNVEAAIERPRANAVRVPPARDHGVARSHPRGGARIWHAADRFRGLVAAADVLPVPDAALGSPSAHRPRLDGRPVLPAGHHEGRAARRTRAGASTAKHDGGSGRPK